MPVLLCSVEAKPARDDGRFRKINDNYDSATGFLPRLAIIAMQHIKTGKLRALAFTGRMTTTTRAALDAAGRDAEQSEEAP